MAVGTLAEVRDYVQTKRGKIDYVIMLAAMVIKHVDDSDPHFYEQYKKLLQAAVQELD